MISWVRTALPIKLRIFEIERVQHKKSGILQLLKRELQFVFFQVFMTQIELNFR